MKVLLVNGSSHLHGTTMMALREMIHVFEEDGIQTEVFQLGGAPIADCLQCHYCDEHGECVIQDDLVNPFVRKAFDADGFVFGSPVYYAHPSGRLLSFLDRVFYSCGKDEIFKPFQFKPGAAVVVARRGGCSAALDAINKYFGVAQMPVAGSTYWNMLHGRQAEDAVHDREGIQTMRNLAKCMIWMMNSSAKASENGVSYPEMETGELTNFVR